MSTRDLDPFIHMDQMGEVDYAPGEPKGTPWHPHRGFETVTYMIDGTFLHQDSHGGGGVITDGATQWMTAGSGILHIETPPEELVLSGGLFHGLQLWVNLPAKDKFSARATRRSRPATPCCSRPPTAERWSGSIAGAIAGHAGPGSRTPRSRMAHATVQPGAQLSLPWQPDYNALVYVLSGRGTVGAEQRPIRPGQLAVFGAGDRMTRGRGRVAGPNRPALEVVLLGGRPIGEPVAHYGPFVMNTKEELMQASRTSRRAGSA